MKKWAAIFLILLVSCGKDSSQHHDPGPRDWDYGNNFHKYKGYNSYNDFYTRIFSNPLENWGVHTYWNQYKRVAFYYKRYGCTSGFFYYWCSSADTNQYGKDYFNLYSRVKEVASSHPFLNSGGMHKGFRDLLTPYEAFAPKVGYAENGLAYWLLVSETEEEVHRIGINPAYPIWANPVMEEWYNKYSKTTTGYYLNYWLYY